MAADDAVAAAARMTSKGKVTVPKAVREALEAAAGAARPADGPQQGWVLIALQNAFHDALRAATVEEGLAAAVLRGGDTDTNAAMIASRPRPGSSRSTVSTIRSRSAA